MPIDYPKKNDRQWDCNTDSFSWDFKSFSWNQKQTAETNKSDRGGLEGCVLHAQKGHKAGCIVPPHLFWLHTGVAMWATLKVAVAESRIATSGRTDAAGQRCAWAYCKPDERQDKVLLLKKERNKSLPQ